MTRNHCTGTNMGILQPSEPVELPENLKWRYTKVKPCMMRGPFMVAAPPLGFETHHPVRRTVPCYSFLKGCTLKCPLCRFRRQYTTYLPLFDLNEPRFYKIVVSGGKKTWSQVRDVKPGTLVALSRGNGEKDTIQVHAWPGAVDPNVLRSFQRKCIDDISPYLFHLWQQRELTMHFNQPYYPSLRALVDKSDNQKLRDEDGNELPQ